jgi:protein-S-isoprenylcysteine O-methyltransferase Ste14
LGDGYRFYRIFFNAVALLTLLPVLAHHAELSRHSEPLVRWEGPMLLVRVLLLVVAGVLFVTGARGYDMLEFLGLRQIRRGVRGPGSSRLATSGVLSLTRHPWYLGALALIWAGRLDAPGLLVNLVLTTYLIVGTMLEERKLVAQFGGAYREYQQRVPMLFPIKWSKSSVPLGRRAKSGKNPATRGASFQEE